MLFTPPCFDATSSSEKLGLCFEHTWIQKGLIIDHTKAFEQPRLEQDFESCVSQS